MEVAHAFGEWDLNAFLEKIPYDLLIYWIVFLNKKKFENTKQDYQLGLIAKAVTEKDTKANYPLDNYVITYLTEDERLEKEEKEQEALFNRLARLPGATVV